MTEEEKLLLKLALSVISGRNLVSDLSDADFSLLGYDVYKFAYYGKPKMNEIRVMCEDILFRLITSSKDSEKDVYNPAIPT